MRPLFSSIALDRSAAYPVYLQLAAQLTNLIRTGKLAPGSSLPSSRQMALLLDLHRKTIVRAYDEMLAQGWLESRHGSGTFVAGHIPQIKIRSLGAVNRGPERLQTAGFSFEALPHLDRQIPRPGLSLHLDDGYPDPSLAPLAELSRAYRTQLLTGNSYQRLGYADAQGSIRLREELARYLNATRGLNITAEHLLITRGSTMGLHLTSMALIKPDDPVVMGSPGWIGAEANFLHAGARLIKLPVDQYGLQTDGLEQICRKTRIRMVYVTPHHHHPTTVALRADRRIQLLQLSHKYGFIIFEDDYDYDFHYQSKPLLPLITADENNMVLYCGSFTKTISPAFRVGYLVAPLNVIQHLRKLRRIIDRQGDTMLENAIAELLQGGVIERYMRKSVRVYRERRDVLCQLLRARLPEDVQFRVPEGGMAVWSQFAPYINLMDLANKAYTRGLHISDGIIYKSILEDHNGIRLGFAALSCREIERSIDILSSVIRT